MSFFKEVQIITSQSDFIILNITDSSVSFFDKKETHNSDLAKWGGNFIISWHNSQLLLTINIGNRKQICSLIKHAFNRLNVDCFIEEPE